MIYHGDLFDVLPTLSEASVDACVTDPPYDLTANKRGGSGEASLNLNSPAGRSRITTGGGFMGKQWDGTGVAFKVETWLEVYRVLKPGAHLLAFGGPRTFHRMIVAIEDAGFEIRDCVSWLYGQGFPKSLDVAKAIDTAAGVERPVVGPSRWSQPAKAGHFGGLLGDHVTPSDGRFTPDVTAPATDEAKQWDGWGTALKPSWEPIVLARKPLDGTVAANVLKWGTGAINVDGCRIEGVKPDTTRGAGGANGRYAPIAAQGRIEDDGLGRWPSNVLLDEEAAAMLDEQSGELTSGFYEAGAFQSMGFQGGPGGVNRRDTYGDTGGASRFFYVAKPSRAEREQGCEFIEPKQRDDSRKEGNPGGDNPRNRGLQRRGNSHPTVKPVELMRYLVRLVTPTGGTVIDPFMGSGSTGMACAYEGVRFIGVEREAEYVEIAERRIAAAAPLLSAITEAGA